MNRIYLDNNATTQPLQRVVDTMLPFFSERFGNASAVHASGRIAREAVDNAREQVAALLNAGPRDILFTSGGTESDNLALFGILTPGDHLITTAIEHHAVLHPAQHLARRGVAVTIVKPNGDGIVTPEAIAEALRPETRLVSVMFANNETGVLQPIAAIAEVVHRHGALLHTDAVQGCGKESIDVRTLGADLLSISAHKMHGPQGAGALWARPGLPLRPILHGGPHERQLRAGTENLPAIAGFGEAAAATREWLASDDHAALNTMHEQLEHCLTTLVPGTTIHGARAARLPNTTSVRFDGVESEALVIALDLAGIAVSGGSACTSGAVYSSHVLIAMGLTDHQARSTIRVSLSRLNTPAEIDTAVHAIQRALARQRS